MYQAIRDFVPMLRMAAFAGTLLACTQASGQAYPSKSIVIQSPIVAGSSIDPVLRMMIEDIQARTGKTMVINAMVGGLGTLAPGAVARAEKDGHTVGLVFAATLTLSPQIMKNPPFDPLKDLAPVSLLTRHGLLIVANPALTANSVAELLALAKSRPEARALSVSYVGTGSQIYASQVAAAAGIKFLGVPYKASSQQITAVMSGETDLAIFAAAAVAPLIKAGKVKPIAIGTSNRTAMLPNVPSISETFPGLEGLSWFGIVAPAGTPRDRIDWLHRELTTSIKIPRAQEAIAAMGFDTVASTPQQMADIIRKEIPIYAKALKDNNIPMED